MRAWAADPVPAGKEELMSAMRLRKGALLGAAAAVAVGAFGSAVSAQVQDLFAVGRNSLGESCSAQLDKRDPAIAEPEFDKSYALSCRSSLASRKVGSLRRVDARPVLVAAVEKTLNCGPAATISSKLLGQVRARRCADSTLAAPTLVLDFQKGGIAYYGSAGLSLAGPLEQGLAIVSDSLNGPPDLAQIKPSFAIDSIPALSVEIAEAMETFNPENALRQGIRLNQQGLHIDASRQLNDAISRLDTMTPPAIRGQLELEAALADSNIGFFKSADAHFAKADQLMVGAADPLVSRKATSYRALHDINRRQFRSALTRLDTLARDPGGVERPLMDPIVLAAVNQAARGRGQGVASLGADDRAALQERALDAVVDWARSTASLALGEVQQAQDQIVRARRSFDVIRGSRIDVSQALWLDARIERQMGRIQGRRGESAAALASFDRAIKILQEAQIRNPGFGSGEISAAQLERADMLARQGAPRDQVLAEFSKAIDSVAASSSPGAVDPSGIERYLDVLANGTDGNGDPAAAEQFFRAVQVVDDPALARQVSQLQEVVSADPSLGAQYRERSDLSQELTAIRYRLAQTSGAEAEALEAERNGLQQRLQQVDDTLASNAKFQSTDDRPATIADVRQYLRDGESFFKLVTLKRSVFGIHITRDDAFIYKSQTAPAKMLGLAAQLRKTLVPDLQRGKILPFRAGLSFELYRAISGAAVDRLGRGGRLVVDPSGPLQTVPIGVLVADGESVRRFVAAGRGRTTGSVDYSKLGFIAASTEVSTALSPRSFVVARKAPPSQAPRKFMGFGEHALPTAALLNQFKDFLTRNGCFIDAPTLSESYNYPTTAPISATELGIAATALGDPQSPLLTGQAFNDQNIIEKSGEGELAKYEVLHFATHGFTEGNWAFCSQSPPSLLTSLAPQGSDGVLSFDEIAKLDLDANLVFLAACDTAAGVEDEELARTSGLEAAGGSLEGLVRAFLTAQARAVVATHWVAPNGDSTLQLVRTFYEAGRNSDVGAAMRAGQSALLRNPSSSHPYFWAPFFVVGDSSKPLVSPQAAMVRDDRTAGGAH